MTATVADLTAGLSLEERAALASRIRAKAARLRTIRECPTPLDLACRFDPTFVRTPALELITARLRDTLRQRDGRLVISVSPQQGKALDCDTPMLTSAGWSTMGALQVGDQVFHPDGHPTAVIAAHPVRHDRHCYKVTTVDGRTVVVDAEHLWTVRDRAKRGRGRQATPAPWETLTTEQLLARGVLSENGLRPNGTPHRAYRFMLPRQHEIVSKPVDLPMDPYVLGAWLGDGDTSGAGFTSADPEIVDHIRAAAYTVTHHSAKYRWYISQQETRTAAVAEAKRLAETGMSMREACRRVGLPVSSNIVMPGRIKGQQSAIPTDPTLWVPQLKSFRAELRDLGVLNNKHVPALYLAAGTEQRLALLQGLLDTDGSIFKTQRSSRVEFTSIKQGLAEDVLYLARSLGWRATINENAAVLNGREVSRRWRVTFTPEAGGHEPFRMQRKLTRVQAPQSRGGELHAVSIASIEPVESRPVRCIKVDREDGLFLAGRDLVATHNTSALRWAIVWALLDEPARRVVFASYAVSLARTSGRMVRGLIETHGEHIGLEVSRSHADASDWELEGHRGGMFSTGRGSMTGRPADVMVLDDPLRDQQEANSPIVLNALHDWYDSVVRTRLAPGAPMIVVATRWVENDLSGRFVGEGWPLVNIPALADGQTPDALERAAGQYLVSARGTTPADWEKTRRDVGERTWAALYQGRPSPLEGGVFKTAWFDTWRIPELPAGCLPPTVVVDPADNEGDGDEAGIILATAQPDTGRVFILDDLSAPMTVARWARVALLTCVRRQAPSLAYEKSLSALPKRIREAWQTLHQQATAIRKANGNRPAALLRLLRADDSLDARDAVEHALAELSDDDVTAILTFGTSGPRIRAIVAKGAKQVRMQLAAPMFETGRAVLVGKHLVLEHQAVTWVVGRDSPDRVDALVHAVNLLAGATPGSLGRAQERLPTSSTQATRGSSRIGRSTNKR